MSYMKSGTQGSFDANKNRRAHRQAAGLVLGLLATLLFVGYILLLTSKRPSTNVNGAVPAAELPPYWAWLEDDGGSRAAQAQDVNRPVYAYSVIPGGVRDHAELKLALARDPVVALHYSGFDAHAAKPIRLARARQVYVSYRIGNHVYWTSKKVTLHAGETLLTDGKHLVRGRCGNRISEVPSTPTLDGEPAEPALGAPLFPHVTAETVDLPPPPPIWTENPILLAMLPTAGPTSGGAPFLPPLPFVPCCAGGTGPHTPLPPTPVIPPGPGSGPSPNPPAPPPSIPQPEPGPSPGPPPPPPVVPPPVATPEPATLELLLVGLVGVFVFRKWCRP